MHEFTANDIADLIEQHKPELLRFLSRRVSCDEDAHDILQETFIRYAEYGTANRVDNVRAFLFRVAANLAVDYRRSHDSRAYADLEPELADKLTDPTPLPEQRVLSLQRMTLLVQALAELHPKTREVFIMVRLKNLSYAETQFALGISQTTLIKHLNRAIDHCRERLDEA